MIGIIGGTGISIDVIENPEQVKAHTPYGNPSDFVFIGTISGKKIAFIPRHGTGHKINPTNVNYRANIFALKELGVKRIFAPCAVGSLKENIKPGEFVFSDQVIDFTKQRKNSFYEGQKVCHISMSKPFCGELRNNLISSAKKLELGFHEKGTNIAIEGPRFSTFAESALFKSWNCDTINMTMMPEAVLAKEMQLCYSPIAMTTDYDNFSDKQLNIESIIQIVKQNAENVKSLLKETISITSELQEKCDCPKSLENALI